MSPAPLRVLHVLNELRPSGAENMLRLAGPMFKAAGCDSHVLSTGAEFGPYAPALAAAGYTVHHRPWQRTPRFWIELIAQWRLLRFDVVHIHAERSNFGYALAARCAGASTVLRTVHNHFQFRGALRWRRAIERRLAARLGTHWVSIAPGVHDNEQRRFGARPVMIANWFDSARFVAPDRAAIAAARQRLQLSAQSVVLLVVGNCSLVKNHGLLLDALAAHRGGNWVLLHAGHEEPGAPERQRAHAHGIADRVRFLGAVDDVLPLLQAADLFVMPSLKEGMSIALLEALGTGLPALLAESPGLVDLRGRFEGLTYAPPQRDAFAQALGALLHRGREDDPARRQRTARVAREQFGIERGVRAYLDLYRTARVGARAALAVPG